MSLIPKEVDKASDDCNAWEISMSRQSAPANSLPSLALLLWCALFIALFIALLLVLWMGNVETVFAANDPPMGDDGGGKRTTIQIEIVSAHHWRLYWWKDNKTACDIYIEHEGEPDALEFFVACGAELYDEWVATPACAQAASGGSTSGCKGLYLRYLGMTTHEIEQVMELPSAEASVDLVDCLPGGTCDQPPELLFAGFEPLPDHEIISVRVKVGEQDFSCGGDTCLLRMPLTGEKGEIVEYWVESSFGDESGRKRFRMRNLYVNGAYRFDLLGDPWKENAPSCALVWDSLPAVTSQTPAWLEDHLTVDQLATDNPYALLAGKLINEGVVDASTCADNGLLPNGAASACGEAAAAPDVIAWQNQYDQQILAASFHSNVPARLLKGVIAQESQFWPQSQQEDEYGLGMITENGLDMLLNWNLPYFVSTCAANLDTARCAAGYSELSDHEQAFLRGVAFSAIGSPGEVDLIAEMLVASCYQSGQLVRNISGETPGEVATYEDMWAFSVGVYHAGAGCMGEAMESAWKDVESLTWAGVSARLDGICENASTYVDRVVELGR